MQPGIRADQQPAPLAVRPDVQTLADELGVDVSTVKGSGKDGAILKGDVRAAAPKTVFDDTGEDSG